jgi:probable F420-dependent oxidoreductase
MLSACSSPWASRSTATTVTVRLMSAEGIATCAQAAEHARFDAVFVTDHPAPDERWLLHGGHPTLDPFVALAFAGAATTSLRLHTNLLVLGYRNPLLTAKAVASLDVLSGGRVLLGVGVGYLESEFTALGADFDERAALADDALVVMRTAWTGEPVHHDGVGYRAVDTVVRPTPRQQPHPPIWVGGNSHAALRRTVAHGNGWAPMPSPRSAQSLLGTPGIESMDELRSRVVRLHDLAAHAGRADPIDVACIPTTLSGFARAPWRPEQVLDEIGQLREAGATALVVNLPGASVEAFCDEVARFGSEVLRSL